MDKEVFYINSILVENSKGLTTSDISKLIFEQYQTKISRTIVKNYLWSYFRNLIEYDPGNYTYKLSNDHFLLDDIEVVQGDKKNRPICSQVCGSKIKIEIEKNVDLHLLVKAIGILNYKIGSNNRNTDLIKQINRIIEQLIN